MNRIKALREKCGINQKELAEVLNVTQGTLSSYETERTQANIETYRAIADFFHTTIDYLLGGPEPGELEVRTVIKFPEISSRYERLDDIDRARVLAYIDGILTAEKYAQKKMVI